MESVTMCIVLLFLIILNQLILPTIASDLNNANEMIINFIKNSNRPSNVLAINCWNQNRRIKFITDLSTFGISSGAIDNEGLFIDAFSGLKHHKLFIVDLEPKCNVTMSFLNFSNENKLFGSPYRWIILESDGCSETEVQNKLMHLNIFIDSDFTIFRQCSGNDYHITQLYKIGKGEPFTVRNYGFWKNKSLNCERKYPVLSQQRKDLMGIRLKASIVIENNDTLNHLTDRVDPHIDSVTKFNYALTLLLADATNFSMDFIQTDVWGWSNENGEWNGMVGHLQREEAEVGGTAIFITTERIDMLDFINSSPDHVCFVFRQPPLSYTSNLFSLPFTRSVWGCCGALVLLMCIVMRIAALWESHLTSNEDGLGIDDWSDVCLLTAGAVFQQGSSLQLHSKPGRLTLFLVFLILMFLFTSYCANIVALLQSTTTNINTLSDLLNSGLKFGVEDNVYNRKYFATVTDPVRKEIYETKIAPPGANPNFMTLEEGVKNLRKGLFAFHMQSLVGYKLMEDTYYEHEKCNLKEIQFLQMFHPHYAVRKNLPYREIFNVAMKKFHEVGLQRREILAFYTAKPMCKSKDGTFVSVGIEDFYPALLWFSYGIVGAMTLFVFEFLIYRLKTNK